MINFIAGTLDLVMKNEKKIKTKKNKNCKDCALKTVIIRPPLTRKKMSYNGVILLLS